MCVALFRSGAEQLPLFSWLRTTAHPQRISPVVDAEDAAKWGLFFIFPLFFLLSGALHERFDVFPATSCFSQLVCAICVAQHKRAACSVPAREAQGSAPKAKPVL